MTKSLDDWNYQVSKLVSQAIKLIKKIGKKIQEATGSVRHKPLFWFRSDTDTDTETETNTVSTFQKKNLVNDGVFFCH